MPLSKIARLAAIAASVAVAAPLLGGSAAAQLYYPQVEPYHGRSLGGSVEFLDSRER